MAAAGDEPIYRPAPNWVEPVDLSTVERDPANDVVVYDNQILLEKGKHWEYRDFVYRIDNAAALSTVGTLTAQWLPDKGDLLVHEIAILRDGQTIDVLEQGEKLEVLRRESQLESLILDGSLTATLSVPGLQVGDELRMRYTVTTSDQALGDEVQSQSYLWREPMTYADFGRVRLSWPEAMDINWQAGPNYSAPKPQEIGGFKRIEVMLPLEEATEMPSDAPLRYRRPTLLQAGTFADWAEVSSTMAPYYDVSGAVAAIPDLKKRADAIRSKHKDELARAVAALELVQEDVRYLMNGLDGGNYLPQSPATTWEKKYGDCKAKTVLLLAMLDYLGIEAEPVLVSSTQGNAVPASLPLPGAFDHVLVRAQIDAQEYFLDGTSLGANILTVGNVPSFEYALPIRKSGAGLEPIEQTLPRYPDMKMDIVADASAGVDLPVLSTLRMTFVGPQAVQMNAEADKLGKEKKRQIARGMGDEGELLDIRIEQGDDDSIATMILTSISEPMFEFEGRRGTLESNAMGEAMAFAPDRSRREWRDIPMTVTAPSLAEVVLRTILPTNAKGFRIDGETSIAETVAGKTYTRKVDFDGNTFVLSEALASKGGEIAPDDFLAERRKAAALSRQQTKLVADNDVPRIWRFARSKDRAELKKLDAAYDKLVANDPDEMDPWLSRAAFRYNTNDFRGALADMDKVVELDGSAEYYAQRSTVHSQLLDLDAALADLEEAYTLDPSPWRAMQYAAALANVGRLDEARDTLEMQDGDEEVQQSLAFALAEIDGRSGNAERGLERIDSLDIDDPNDSDFLSEKCWYMATWAVDISDGLAVCTKAVENSGEAANVIDSRALMYLRNGMVDKAFTDIETALAMEPGQTASLLLRGYIRKARGDADWKDDVDEALAREPELATTYSRWGFDL